MSKIFWEVIIKFATEHFVGIIKALTIHREFAVVELRDIFGVFLRVTAISLFFVDLPILLKISVFSLLALSLLFRIFEAIVTAWLLREVISTSDKATQPQQAELDPAATV